INPTSGFFTWTPTAGGQQPGTYSVTVDAEVDSSPQDIVRETFSVNVSAAASSTALAASAASATAGQSVSFTATVQSAGGAPAGTVAFYDGQTKLSDATLQPGGGGSQATYSTAALGVGTHSITAQYPGVPAITGSGSPAQQVVIAA